MIELIAQNEGAVLVNFGSAFVNSRSNKMFSEIQNTVETWRVKNNFKIEDKKVEEYKNLLIKKMNPFADIEDVLDAIDHVNNLVGDDYIGFGSDYDGLGNTLPNNLKDVSTYVNLLEGLINRGYSRESIEKICYKNFFRVWDANLQNHQT